MTGAAVPAHPVVSHLEETLGLSFTGPRRERLLTTVEGVRRAAGLSDEEFLAELSRPGRTSDRLIAEVTVGETYFFRDRSQCDMLLSLILPTLAAGKVPDQRLTMWSAGCASGEEAYTLAALADSAGLLERCLVVGSDASARAIEKADAAVYGRWSMRSIVPEELSRNFDEQAGRFHVAERLQERTRFVQRNLLDGAPPPGRFDVVLCRNLLIYLTRDAVQRAAEVLAGSLARDGWLITGVGDPPLQAEGLAAVRTSYGLAYRRVQAPPLAVPEVPARPPSRHPAVPLRRARPSPSPGRSRVPAASGSREPTGRRAPSTDVLAEQIRALGDAGRLREACDAAAAAVGSHPDDVQLRYLAAVVLLEAGRLEEAAAAASAAVYLAPQLPAVHLLLGQVEHARGSTDRARRSFRNGSRLLATAPDEARVALAGDVPAGHLAAIATHYLSTQGPAR